jgi:predicted RNA binding protein with dsRBD fold (UPF0201 family)
MSETVRTIEELTKVHEAIRHYVTGVKVNIGDLESVSSQCSGEFDSEQCKIVADRQFSLRQNLQYLREGLQDHHQREGILLGPLIGDILMNAVNKECSEITKQFERVKVVLEAIEQSQLSPTDLAVKTKQARQAIETFSNLVESHSRKMDTILQMLRSAM